MGVVSLDHVGIAAPSADLPLARAFGAGPLALTEMPSGVAIARFGPGERLEVVTPARSGSPVERFLERRGPGLHHVAFEVEGALASVLAGLRAAGLEPVGSIEPSSDGRPSVFLHPGSTGGVLVELVEGPRRA
ncbi:MAG: VOC family protein [Thermoleophilia bacterium]|nr:VOC family protein [Thermoleophilia bacterium]